jgi:hypothetical protein
MRRACLAGLRALACAMSLSMSGCSDPGFLLEPVVEVPPASSSAYPYQGIDALELSIARAGDDAPLALATAAPGEPLALADVPFGSDLIVHLSGTAAGVEIAYGRTCVVDVLSGAPAPAPHLYFSRIVRWGSAAAAAPLAADRTGGHAYALPDGRAVFLGGDRDAIEIFDPVASGAFSALSPRTLVRRRSLLVPFATGQAIVIGGVDENDAAVPTIEIVDPAAGEARQRETMDGPALVGHAGVALVDDSVIVAGGLTRPAAGGAPAISGAAWRFRIGAGGVLDAPELLPAAMNLARSDHTMTRLGSELGADVLIVGGRDGEDVTAQPVAQAELYRPLREAFEPIAGAQLGRPRWGHAAVRMPGGFVLVLGGLTADPLAGVVPVSEMELYDPVQGTFAPAGTLPASAGLTDATVTPLPDGRVLLAGGRDATGAAVDTVLIARLDPIDGDVDLSPSDRLSTPRAGHSAVSLCDGTILVAGGTPDPAAPAERYNPPSLGRR